MFKVRQRGAERFFLLSKEADMLSASDALRHCLASPRGVFVDMLGPSLEVGPERYRRVTLDVISRSGDTSRAYSVDFDEMIFSALDPDSGWWRYYFHDALDASLLAGGDRVQRPLRHAAWDVERQVPGGADAVTPRDRAVRPMPGLRETGKDRASGTGRPPFWAGCGTGAEEAGQSGGVASDSSAHTSARSAGSSGPPQRGSQDEKSAVPKGSGGHSLRIREV